MSDFKMRVTLVDNVSRDGIHEEEWTIDKWKYVIQHPQRRKNKINAWGIHAGHCEWIPETHTKFGETKTGIKKDSLYIITRSVLILDIDNPDPYSDLRLNNYLTNENCTYFKYSTFSATEERKKYRVVIPLNREVSASEYISISAYFLYMFNENKEFIDPVSGLPDQLMFLPTRHVEQVNGAWQVQGYYDYTVTDTGNYLNTEKIIHFTNTYPEVMRRAPRKRDRHTEKKEAPVKSAAYNEKSKLLGNGYPDPRTLDSIVGTFTTLYDCYYVLDNFLKDKFEKCGSKYRKYGSMNGAGLEVLDDGLFVFNHHSTMASHGKVLNSYDLLRTEMFDADEDDESLPIKERHSYKEVYKFVLSIPEIKMKEDVRRRNKRLYGDLNLNNKQ